MKKENSAISEVTATNFSPKDNDEDLSKPRLFPSLVIIFGNEIGKIFKVHNNDTIGRGIEADIKINEISISRQHAKISMFGKDKVLIEDLNSKNGTLLNNEPVKKSQINNYDRIKVGNTILKFMYIDKLEKKFQDKLFTSTIEDGLTGIYNKKFFQETFHKEFSFSKRHKVPLSLLIFDIDNFKKINDKHGHAAGDVVLQGLVNLIKPIIRNEDVFARIGGEEFALILKQTKKDDAYMLAERIRKTVKKTKFKHKSSHSITISIGCETFENDNFKNPSKFFDGTDSLLLKAKKQGKNMTLVADKSKLNY